MSLMGVPKECASVLFPGTLRKEKREYFERIKSAVEKYKPLIEEQIGIDLGDVPVREGRFLDSDTWRIAYESICSDIKDKSEVTPLRKLLFNCTAYSMRGIILFVRMYHEDVSLLTYCRWNSSIYVHQGLLTKLRIVREMNYGKEEVDQDAVHELTHCVWHKLEGEGTQVGSEDWKFWNEIYSIYGELNWFSGLYPKEYKITTYLRQNRHLKGKQKIEELVGRYGKEILLRIPKEWENLEI